MAYTLRYHPRVVNEDLGRIPSAARTRISRAIETRLTSSPERFGIPLAGTLKGYGKLRVGDYRVVFQLRSGDVWILAVVHRRDVYERAARRMR